MLNLKKFSIFQVFFNELSDSRMANNGNKYYFIIKKFLNKKNICKFVKNMVKILLV
jgi:hypothetical protein